MHGEPLPEPYEFEIHWGVESGGAPPHSKTLARWLRGPKIRQVLECAAAAALSISHEVMVRNACGGNPVHFSFAQD